jgi:hypothetical protein
MSDVDEWPTYKMVSFETKCFNGLQRCCLHDAVNTEKVLASLVSQAIVFVSLSTNLVPLCPHCFNPAFTQNLNPYASNCTHIHAAKSNHAQTRLQIATECFGGHSIFFNLRDGNWYFKA